MKEEEVICLKMISKIEITNIKTKEMDYLED
jgi:hypothetical protein